ncbi:MAG: hypothetical protein M3Q56_08530 [Bacteroidota bacterium]|nr:hypothetical protein [Bacteroidota bacterium]
MNYKILFNFSLFLLGIFFLAGFKGSSHTSLRNIDGSSSNRKLFYIDTVAPTASCFDSYDPINIKDNGCVTLNAKDFDQGSFDDMTSKENLNFYFDGDPTKKTIQICCDDFVAVGVCDEYKLMFQLWVEDESGNTDFCSLTVYIHDNLAICAFNCMSAQIRGNIITPLFDPLSEGSISLIDTRASIKEKHVKNYFFGDLSSGNYLVCPNRKDDVVNGVTTADVVTIRKHILGSQKLNSPYLLLAADVNQNKIITASDISEIRRTILGLQDTFLKSPSWVFIPTDIVLTDLNNPSPINLVNYCESITLTVPNKIVKNFYGIKMGDVNNSAKASKQDAILKQRNSAQAILNYQNEWLDNNLVESKFYFSPPYSVQALQYSLHFDPELFEFQGIYSKSITINEEHASLHDLKNGTIHIAWDGESVNNMNAKPNVLFSIIWNKKLSKGGDLNLQLDPSGVAALAYDDSLHEYEIILKFSGLKISGFGNDALIQANINTHTRGIQTFTNLQMDTKLAFHIYDLMGKLICTDTKLIQKGNRTDHLLENCFGQHGIYILKISSADYFQSIQLWY